MLDKNIRTLMIYPVRYLLKKVNIEVIPNAKMIHYLSPLINTLRY